MSRNIRSWLSHRKSKMVPKNVLKVSQKENLNKSAEVIQIDGDKENEDGLNGNKII